MRGGEHVGGVLNDHTQICVLLLQTMKGGHLKWHDDDFGGPEPAE